MRAPRLKPAIRYYSDLLGRPVENELYDGELYVFHLANGRKLLLDDIRQCDVREPQSRPAAIFVTERLGELHDRATDADFAYVSGIEAGINYPYFVCRDENHNEFVVAERPFGYPGAAETGRGGPIEGVVACVTVPVSDVRKAHARMTKWMSLERERLLPSLNDTESPRSRLLLPDGSYMELVPQLEGVRPSAPIVRLQAGDLPGAYRHIKSIGARMITAAEEAEQGRPILFSGTDGHVLSVEPDGGLHSTALSPASDRLQ
ncbi:hypothetical protein [Paenibacillus thermotolerans]|uniref:hypothetical protein n=1 Tax=Paenibacillus thermotolerans TaxID=3027807 RepID=UPI00236776EF|nr:MULTISPECIES: hypothetical protein [unclassified Paenibacillus]